MSPDTGEKVKLTPKQSLFAELYVSKEFFGNGVQTYIEVYNPDQSKPNWYNTARATSSEILTNPNVCARINELLESEGLNDEFVDKQLLFLITQHDDKVAKLNALREYNKLKARITDKSEQTIVADVTSNGETVGTSQLDTIMQTLKDTTAKQA